jgi:hypothetical protein
MIEYLPDSRQACPPKRNTGGIEWKEKDGKSSLNDW